MLELTESQVNGRFHILPVPVAAPGKCSVCGSVERPVVDFGLEVDYYGAVVFCVECLRSAADLLDMVPGADLRVAQLVQRAHEDEIMKAGEIVNEYAHLIHDLNVEFTDRLRGIFDSTVVKSNASDDRIDSDPAGKSPVDSGQPDDASLESLRIALSEGPNRLPGNSGHGSFDL